MKRTTIDAEVLYTEIERRPAKDFLWNLGTDLERLPPNGSNNHKRANLSSYLRSYASCIADGTLPDVTFGQLRRRDSDSFKTLFSYVHETYELFPIARI
jgi:hypothetical protein